MRGKFLRRVVIGAAFALAFAAAYWIAHTRTVRAQASVHPFTATMVDEQTQGPPPSSHERIVHYTFAVRSDGSSVHARRVEAPDGTWAVIKTVIDRSKGKRVFVDGVTQSISTTPLSEKYISYLNGEAKGCTTAPPPFSQPKPSHVLGYSAVETSFSATTRWKGAHVTMESWKVPQLGCFEIAKTTTWTTTEGAVANEHTIKALTVVEGQPSAALFDVPTNYTERSPGDILRVFAQKYHRPDHPETDAMADRNYVAARAGAR